MYLFRDPLSAAGTTAALSWMQAAARELRSFKPCVQSPRVSSNTHPVPLSEVWEYISQQLVPVSWELLLVGEGDGGKTIVTFLRQCQHSEPSPAITHGRQELFSSHSLNSYRERIAAFVAEKGAWNPGRVRRVATLALPFCAVNRVPLCDKTAHVHTTNVASGF
jgi:hypothetical protein